MEAALLICDELGDKYKMTYTDYLVMFGKAFPEIRFTPYEVYKSVFPDNITDHAIYFMTGSRLSVYDDKEWIIEAKSFIQQIYNDGRKFIGVCFGHQMMAEALGGKVLKAESGWNVGVKTFDVLKKKAWMEPITESFDVQMMCQDQVVLLPSKAENLATTLDCKYGMMCIGNQMLSLQGHPEFPIEFSKALIGDRKERIGVEKAGLAMASYRNKCDLEAVKRMIINFLNY